MHASRCTVYHISDSRTAPNWPSQVVSYPFRWVLRGADMSPAASSDSAAYLVMAMDEKNGKRALRWGLGLNHTNMSSRDDKSLMPTLMPNWTAGTSTIRLEREC
jgi:hypothetical protein